MLSGEILIWPAAIEEWAEQREVSQSYSEHFTPSDAFSIKPPIIKVYPSLEALLTSMSTWRIYSR